VKRASIVGKIMSWIDYKFFYRDPLFRPLSLKRIVEMIDNRADLVLDVKQPGIEDKLLDFLRDTGFHRTVYISSEFHQVIKNVKTLDKKVLTIAPINIMPVDIVGLVKRAEADYASIHVSLIDEKIVRELHNEDIGVLVWTVNDVKQILTLLDMNVDGIVTDRPDVALATLRIWKNNIPLRNSYNPITKPN